MWNNKARKSGPILLLFIITGLLLSFMFACHDDPFPGLDAINKTGIHETVFRSKRIFIEGTGYMADYGIVKVFENSREREGKTLVLPFIRIHSNNPDKSFPVFNLNGGPGATNLSYGPEDFVASVLKNHDAVFVGYRGVDGSTILAFDHTKHVMTQVDGEVNTEFLKDLAQACDVDKAMYTSKGVDLDNYTLMNVIDDIEVVRKALGYRKINLLSNSYGTRVAYIYSLRFPQSVFRSIMVGVNPPGRFVWEPEMIEDQLEYYNEIWRQSPSNLELSPNILTTMSNVIESMPDNWLLFKIDPYKVRAGTFALLFNKNTSKFVFDAYIAAENGDYSGIALISAAYGPSITDTVLGDMLIKGGSADVDPLRDYHKDMGSGSTVLGSPLSEIFMGPLKYSSLIKRRIPQKYREMHETETETLLVNGSVDFSTPPYYAEHEMLPYLKNGRLVILKEMGHVGDVFTLQNPALSHMVLTFFDRGIVDDSLYRYDPVDFNVTIGLPEIAKLIVFGIPLFIVAIGILLGLARVTDSEMQMR